MKMSSEMSSEIVEELAESLFIKLMIKYHMDVDDKMFPLLSAHNNLPFRMVEKSPNFNWNFQFLCFKMLGDERRGNKTRMFDFIKRNDIVYAVQWNMPAIIDKYSRAVVKPEVSPIVSPSWRIILDNLDFEWNWNDIIRTLGLPCEHIANEFGIVDWYRVENANKHVEYEWLDFRPFLSEKYRVLMPGDSNPYVGAYIVLNYMGMSPDDASRMMRIMKLSPGGRFIECFTDKISNIEEDYIIDYPIHNYMDLYSLLPSGCKIFMRASFVARWLAYNHAITKYPEFIRGLSQEEKYLVALNPYIFQWELVEKIRNMVTFLCCKYLLGDLVPIVWLFYR